MKYPNRYGSPMRSGAAGAHRNLHTQRCAKRTSFRGGTWLERRRYPSSAAPLGFRRQPERWCKSQSMTAVAAEER